MASEQGDFKVGPATVPSPGQRERVGLGKSWSARDLLNYQESPWRHELIDGELYRMAPTGEEHGQQAGLFFGLLFLHVHAHRLGSLRAAETGYLTSRNPDTVLAPDCSYVSAAKLKEHKTTARFSEVVPDLVAEVLSPGDRARTVLEKVGRWLDFGVTAVVVVSPKRRSVTVYQAGGQTREYGRGETIDLDFVVPGFRLEVSHVLE